MYKELEIYGIMRAVWIHCKQAKRHWIGDDLSLSFGLPAGSYASVVVEQILNKLDEKL